MAIPFFRKDRNKPETDQRQQADTGTGTDFTTLMRSPGDDLGIVVEESGSTGESAIDEAAMLYASNQPENAEALLKTLLPGNDRRAWHMLFDLYRINQREADFEKLALEFAMRFESSPPIWKAREEKNNKSRGVTRPLVLPARLDAGIGEKLQHILANLEKGAILQLDFSRVEDVDEGGAQAIADMLGKARKTRLKFQVSGASSIIELLKSRMQAEPAAQGYWQMQLAVYQLLGRQEEFENLAVDFAVAFELSPPSWENVQAAQEVAAPAEEVPTDAFVLKGVISEASADQIAKLMKYAEPRADVVVDCSGVTRVDYAYVGNLIGQLMHLLGTGKTITLQGQNALVNELFRIMGIDQLARTVPAKLV
ncbi:MAG: STAS domain-containing protein [Pseudomonadota bacterium]